ncbi:hypothetical protein ECANGB1_304 [Enterospora canceri]|uniref:Uncharacterized protein n=1 Tax=Enterospora canceri TaxID=1081671 RepID=A0A1Y1S8V6_9MICR|nr:hypothetical protein ECANGB1_304 [Enterospora canceri]
MKDFNVMEIETAEENGTRFRRSSTALEKEWRRWAATEKAQISHVDMMKQANMENELFLKVCGLINMNVLKETKYCDMKLPGNTFNSKKFIQQEVLKIQQNSIEKMRQMIEKEAEVECNIKRLADGGMIRVRDNELRIFLDDKIFVTYETLLKKEEEMPLLDLKTLEIKITHCGIELSAQLDLVKRQGNLLDKLKVLNRYETIKKHSNCNNQVITITNNANRVRRVEDKYGEFVLQKLYEYDYDNVYELNSRNSHWINLCCSTYSVEQFLQHEIDWNNILYKDQEPFDDGFPPEYFIECESGILQVSREYSRFSIRFNGKDI